MLVREDGSISNDWRRLRGAEVWAAAKEVIQVEALRRLPQSLNNDGKFTITG